MLTRPHLYLSCTFNMLEFRQVLALLCMCTCTLHVQHVYIYLHKCAPWQVCWCVGLRVANLQRRWSTRLLQGPLLLYDQGSACGQRCPPDFWCDQQMAFGPTWKWKIGVLIAFVVSSVQVFMDRGHDNRLIVYEILSHDAHYLAWWRPEFAQKYLLCM